MHFFLNVMLVAFTCIRSASLDSCFLRLKYKVYASSLNIAANYEASRCASQGSILKLFELFFNQTPAALSVDVDMATTQRRVLGGSCWSWPIRKLWLWISLKWYGWIQPLMMQVLKLEDLIIFKTLIIKKAASVQMPAEKLSETVQNTGLRLYPEK